MRMILRLMAAAFAVSGLMTLEAQQEAELGVPPRVDWSRVKAAGAAEVRTAGSGNWIDTSIRAEVVAAWNASMAATENTAMGWTGAIAGCVPGTTDLAFRNAVAARINWFRGMAGVPTGITLSNPTWNAQDQQAALMMSANNSLDHTPPTNWTCYTAGGATAAGNSNLCYTFNLSGDPGCVSLYIKDSGSSNGPVGHRRWLLYPQTQAMGTGDVAQSGSNGRANALWVFDGNFGGTRPATREEFVAWPAKGFVPYQAVFPRWSFSYPNADFSNTVVTMTRTGAALALTKLPVEAGYGENTLVWEPAINLGIAPGADSAVDVTLTNVLVNGQARSFSYRVTIIDPANTVAPPPPPEGLIDVVIDSVPSGRSVGVDGFLYTTPRTFQWVPDTSHSISTTTTQDRGVAGERFVFANWSDGGALAHTITPSVAGTYTATFTTQYLLQTTASPLAGGTVSPATGNYYASGQVVPLTATTATGYSFSGWSGDVTSASAATSITMTKPSAVTASFAAAQPSTITVTFTSVPTGRTVVVDGTTYTTPQNLSWIPSSTHTVSTAATQAGAVSGERFVFSSWSDGGAISHTVSPTAGTTFTATFGTQYSLQTPVSPGGAGTVIPTPSSSDGYYASGQVVTLNVNPGLGYNFSNWSGDASGTNQQTTITMTKPSVASAVFVPLNTNNSGLHFVPVTPCRVADTRDPAGPFGGPILAGGAARSFSIPQSNCGIPSTAKAFSLNVTVVPPVGLGYLTIWPTGQAQPFVSTLNSNDAQVTANAAIVPAGTGGAVSVFVTNQTHLILDINGYFDDPGAPNALAYYPVTPCRIADTREPAGTFGGPSIPTGGTRTLPIRQSSCGLPASATAYAFNVTVVPPGTLGYISAWPAGQAQPLVSTTNSYDGQVTANMAIVPAGTDGSVSFFASNQTHLVVDVMGYFAPPGAPNALRFFPVAPCRIADTRELAGALGGPVMDPGAIRSFPFTQATCGLPVSARAYSANFTVVPATVLGYLTTWPTGSAQPFVSTLNSLNGQITANAALVPAGTNAAVSVVVTDRSHVVIDTNGYFAP